MSGNTPKNIFKTGIPNDRTGKNVAVRGLVAVSVALIFAFCHAFFP
jgi:hypothetical protein